MSRVGKLPIPVPAGVTVSVANGVCTVTGPKGTLTQDIHENIGVALEDGVVQVSRPDDKPSSGHPREHRGGS